MKKAIKRIGNCFQTGLLWKDESLVLPASKPLALQRLTYIERRMKKDESLPDDKNNISFI